MTHHLIQRSIALGLSAIVTLAMLGGIDGLAQRDDGPQWAEQAATLAQPHG